MYVKRMMVQGLPSPVGVDTEQPVFSYQLERSSGEEKGGGQGACRLLVSSSEKLLAQDRGDLWDSGKMIRGETYGIQYKGRTLLSGQTAYWKVMVWDQNGDCAGWSEISSFETGLRQGDWQAVWIGQGDDYKGDKSTAPLFAGEFFIRDRTAIRRARLYISGLGLYQASLNGRKLADTLFDPGECDATKTVWYVTYDVLDDLREGENVLGVVLGNGQYTNFEVNPVMSLPDGTLCPEHRYQKNDGAFVKPGISGDKKLIAQLELTDRDGRREIVLATDATWRWTDGPVVFQNWYGGEDYDATREVEAWDLPGMDRDEWKPARCMKAPAGLLTAREFPPIRVVEKFAAKSVIKLSGDTWLADMGRNGAGFPQLCLETTEEMRGTWIRLYPAELLKEDGNGVDQVSCTQSWNQRFHCEIRDSYRMKGTGKEVWHPSFCYQGFQYLEIKGWQGELKKENVCMCLVRTDNKMTGTLTTSNEILNQISNLVEHSMESNMFSAFTDCPQIEKLGWIETSHLMFRSLSDCYDINAWMRKIIHDIADSQIDSMQASIPGNEPEGYVPAIIPEYQRIVGLHRDPNWNGACIFTPWEHYWCYGDAAVLEQMYPVMQKYICYLSGCLKDGVLKDYAQMGEWGELTEHTPEVLVASCAYYRMLDIMSQTASILGYKEESEGYRIQAESAATAFYADPDCYDPQSGVYGSGSQASYGCVLFSGLVPEEKREETVGKLVRVIAQNDYHLSSGEVGLKQVFSALAENGRNDIVYRMVMNKTAPGYRYFAESGMTTLPEYWNCNELWHGMARSRNHAMMGHVKEWMSRYMLGIRPVEPAYKKVVIDPYLPPDVQEMKGSVLCPYGRISVECRRQGDETVMKTELPVGVELAGNISV